MRAAGSPAAPLRAALPPAVPGFRQEMGPCSAERRRQPGGRLCPGGPRGTRPLVPGTSTSRGDRGPWPRGPLGSGPGPLKRSSTSRTAGQARGSSFPVRCLSYRLVLNAKDVELYPKALPFSARGLPRGQCPLLGTKQIIPRSSSN